MSSWMCKDCGEQVDDRLTCNWCAVYDDETGEQ